MVKHEAGADRSWGMLGAYRVVSILDTKERLVGMLYLENQLAVGAFTLLRFSEGDATRTQVLNLLSTQAAIAIENAKLYSKLRKSKSQMTQFLEAVLVGIAVVDATGRPYYFNQRAIQLVGKGADPSLTLEQLAEAYQVYLAGTAQPYPTEKMPTIRALSGERTRVDDVEIHQNNVTIPIESWETPVFDEQGNVAYALAAFQDITERKQAEQLLVDYNRTLEQQVAQRTAALQASEAALREREQELRLIADALPALIGYVNTNGRFQFVNRAYEVWFRCSRDEILGKSVRELLGETAYHIAAPSIKQAKTGQITTYEAEITYPVGKKYVSATYIPDFGHNDRVKGYYVLVTDISEQRNAALRERKRAQVASILEERNCMAREIYNRLAQAFTGILIQVGAATQVLTDDAEAIQAHLDNGQGFGVVGVPARGGFGLLGMSERAERIGAQLTIRSQPGQGTEIVVVVNP